MTIFTEEYLQYIFMPETFHYYVNVSLWVSSSQNHYSVKQRAFLPLSQETVAAKGQTARKEAADEDTEKGMQWGAVANPGAYATYYSHQDKASF